MALQNQTVSIGFLGGIETKQDEKLVLEGKLTMLINGVFKKASMAAPSTPGVAPQAKIAIKKRFGYDFLPQGIGSGATSITDGDALNTFKDELLLYDNANIYSFSSSTSKWNNKGSLISIFTNLKNIVRSQATQTGLDLAFHAFNNGAVGVYAWSESGGIKAKVTDFDTGASFIKDTVLNASAVNARCLDFGGYLWVLYVSGTSLVARRIDPADPTSFSSAFTLTTDVNGTTKFFDAVAFGSDKAIVAYRNTAGDLKTAFILNSGAFGSVVAGTPDPVTAAVTADKALTIIVDPTNFNIFIGYISSSTGANVIAYQSNLTSLFTSTVLAADTTSTAITGVYESPTLLTFYWQIPNATVSNYSIKTNTISSSGAIGTASTFKKSVGLAGKIFYLSGIYYVPCVHDSTLQATYFLIRSSGEIISKSLPGEAGGVLTTGMLPSVALYNAKYYQAAQIKTALLSENSTIYTPTGFARLEYDFTSTQRYFAAEIANNLITSGGVVSLYDGLAPVEYGFNLFPEDIALSSSPTTAGFMSNGNYQYAAVWEWIDNQGQVHRSSPSAALAVVLTGGTGTQRNILTIPTLRLTLKDGVIHNSVSVAVYRTVNSGGVFYRVSSLSSPTLNDLTVDSITFNDTLADASITGNEILYTAGGVLENDAPLSAKFITNTKSRGFYISAEDPYGLYCSREATPNEGLAFSYALRKQIDAKGGEPTALASMDDKVIIFKEKNIFYLSGQGPNDTGLDDNFTEVTAIASDVGCSDQNTIAVYADGLLFKSEKGIYKLTRNLELQYVGDRVEAYNDLTITSADTLPKVNQIRFVTSDGVALVYDYYVNEWSVFDNHMGKDAVVWNSAYTYLRNSSGAVYSENETKFLDDNIPLKLKIGTAWIKLAGLQGFQRIRRSIVLGKYMSDHKLSMRVSYDYNADLYDQYYFDAAGVLVGEVYGDGNYGDDSPYGGSADTLYQFRTHLTKQKCQAIRFEFEDIMDTVYGESFELTDLMLEVGIKQGVGKLKAAKTV